MREEKKQEEESESLKEEKFEIWKSGEWKNMDIWLINLNSNSNICSVPYSCFFLDCYSILLSFGFIGYKNGKKIIISLKYCCRK